MSAPVEREPAPDATSAVPEAAETAVNTAASTVSPVAVSAPELKQKKTATPKQLEALRLARVAKQEKAAARKLECEKLAQKIAVEQNTDSDSEEAEYIIKRVKKKARKQVVTKEEVADIAAMPRAKPAAAVETAGENDGSSDDDDDGGRVRSANNTKQKKSAALSSPEFTLNFV